jgi:hypothetical protein
VTMGLAGILRRGKFSQDKETEKAPIPTISPCESPSGHSGRVSLSRRVKQVRFWFHDEASIADTYATEGSMQFGDLGLNDSSEEFFHDHEDSFGQGSMKGELPFIEVMDFDGCGYGERGLNNCDRDDDDYLVNKFNASTIHEEMGASFGSFGEGFASFSSLLSEDEPLEIIEENKEGSPGSHTGDGFRCIPDLDDDSANHDSKFEDSCRYSKEQEESPKRRIMRQPTPPPAPFDQSTVSSFLPEDSTPGLSLSPAQKPTPRIGNHKRASQNISDSSLDLSSRRQSESSSLKAPQGKDVSVASDTSSESPTGVTELQRDDEGDTDEDDDDTKEASNRSNLVSTLVPVPQESG